MIEMNSKELVNAALNCEEVDRVPFFPPFQGFWALGLAGLKTMDSFRDTKAAAKAQLDVVEPCHLDAVEVLWDWLFPVEALGCQVKIPDHGTIATISPIINEPGDLDKLEMPDLDKFYRYAAARDTAKEISDKIGKDHYLMASLPGPFTLAGEIRGVEALLMDTLMDPDFAKTLLNKAAEFDKEVIDYVSTWDIDGVLLCDPTTSGDLMSREDFVALSQGPLKETGSYLKKTGKDFIVHMCGDTNDRITDIADTGCKAFTCDKQVDIKAAVETLNGRMAMIGNIDPAGAIFMGTPDEVRNATRAALEAGGKKGFLVGSGCDIPVGASLENIKAITEVSMNFR
ncbi:MAG: uroporphyrinogen decarboxylase family protein [Candidatus Methanomethylophilaceae archaeon]|nr:uroporphyrinogen decarboxylase family protein [Candidatus Methanomethylophilaceae archaeon]